MKPIKNSGAVVAIIVLPLIAGCASKRVAEVAPLPAVAVAPERVAMPRPPANAAPNLNIPAPMADGSFASPNRALTPPATVWHLRAGLNVAALQCGGDASNQYNAVLKAHRAAFASAHGRVAAEYRGGGGDWQDRFDDSMTRLYNYFAQPPAERGFCDAARPVLAQAADVAPADFEAFAATALAAIDRPFTDFYARYHRYRVELAAWHADGGAGPPRLTVDPAVLAGSDQVTVRGRIQYAQR